MQILLAIFAVEALGQFNQVKDGAAPGDLGFDPLNLKPSDPETWEKVQVSHLKSSIYNQSEHTLLDSHVIP